MTDSKTFTTHGSWPVDDSQQHDTHSDDPARQEMYRLWFDLKAVVNLLDKRRDEMSPIEFNGLLRLGFRLRKAFFSQSPQYMPADLEHLFKNDVDGVLNSCVLKLPAIVPTVDDWRRWIDEARHEH